jgi:hypothetical protein
VIKYFKIALIFVLLLFWGLPSLVAQQLDDRTDSVKNSVTKENKNDTLQHPLNNKKAVNGITDESTPNKQHTQSFYDSLLTKNSNKRWIHDLKNIVITPSKTKTKDTIPSIPADLEFIRYEGLIIRNIRFVKVDVFGASVIDTSSESANWIEKTANSLHVKTNTRILEKLLLFHEGDVIESRVLSDNVRLYRDLSFIEDARIIVKPVENSEGEADITIITKDQWSNAFIVELSDYNAGHLDIWNHNILGTGNEILNSIHWDQTEPEKWGYGGLFNTRNIGGTFIDGRIDYSNIFSKESYGLRFSRKFFTPDIKWAGGAAAFYQSSVRNIWKADSGYYKLPVSFNSIDTWVGRSIKLNKKTDLSKIRLNLILATRIVKYKYFDRPPVAIQSNYDFHNKTQWLNSVAISTQSFYESNLIYNFGRTEDIPIGSLLDFTFGPEFGEFKNRMYSSISYSRGNYLDNLGYFYFKAEGGGFITNSEKLEQGILHLQLKYFSSLFVIGQFKIRQFIDFNYSKGINRYENDRLLISENAGLRGFRDSNINGQQRFVTNLETVAFSPWYLLGFRFAFFGFLDYVMLAPESARLIYDNTYTGLGLGIRIHNEHLVFPTFSLRLSFYPNIGNIPLDKRLNFSGEVRLKPDNFYMNYPAIINFQ